MNTCTAKSRNTAAWLIPSLTAEQQRQVKTLYTPIATADSYKYSHPDQFMGDIVGMYDYYTHRSGDDDSVYFWGLDYYLKEYLARPFDEYDVEVLAQAALAHGIPFRRDDFLRMIRDCGGYLPLEIRAVAEGKSYPLNVPLFTISHTREAYFWVVGMMETLLMKVWYSSAVATRARNIKALLQQYFQRSSIAADIAINYAYHNFGARGSASHEQSIIGGMAHLQLFNGSDNFAAIKAMEIYAGKPMSDYVSIPATEHSTTTSAGADQEYAFIERYVERCIDAGYKLFAAVMDSTDIYAMTRRVIAPDSNIRTRLTQAGAKLVLRPDSGDPVEVLRKLAAILKEAGVLYKNDRGFLSSEIFGVLWGDGINEQSIGKMCELWVDELGFSMDMLAFGSGGDLMQNHQRDDHGAAIKCSQVSLRNGDTRDVCKNPLTDPGKASMKGAVTTVENIRTGEIYTAPDRHSLQAFERDLMHTVYRVN